MGWVHCFDVAFSYASANWRADCPVSDDLNGCEGDHHTSVERPSPRSPSASIDVGNRSAFPIEMTFGLKPCWRAWTRKFFASGGITTPVTICAPPCLNAAICAEKSCVMD